MCENYEWYPVARREFWCELVAMDLDEWWVFEGSFAKNQLQKRSRFSFEIFVTNDHVRKRLVWVCGMMYGLYYVFPF